VVELVDDSGIVRRGKGAGGTILLLILDECVCVSRCKLSTFALYLSYLVTSFTVILLMITSA
jgi:hypothetical protein